MKGRILRKIAVAGLVSLLIGLGGVAMPSSGKAVPPPINFNPGGSGINEYNLGLGGGVGYPIMGGSVRYYFNDFLALQAMGGTSPGGFGVELQLTGPHHILYRLYATPELSFTVYGGIGAMFYQPRENGYEWNEFGPQGVLGFSAVPDFFPIELSLEWKPGWYFAVGDSGGQGGGWNVLGIELSLRFYLF